MAPFSLLLACISLGDDGPGDGACTEIAAASLTVSVVDEGGATVDGASASFTVDGADGGACEPWPSGGFVCGWEVPGEIEVTVSADGYEPGSASATIGMDADGCHVVGEAVTVTLHEEQACTAEVVPSVVATIVGSSGETLSEVSVSWGLANTDMAPQLCEGEGETWTCGEDVAGDLEIYAAASGHQDRIVPVTVGMTDDECHVVTEAVEIALDWLPD